MPVLLKENLPKAVPIFHVYSEIGLRDFVSEVVFSLKLIVCGWIGRFLTDLVFENKGVI